MMDNMADIVLERGQPFLLRWPMGTTGLSVTLAISQDGGGCAPSTNPVAASAITNWYQCLLTGSETDAGSIDVQATAPGYAPVNMTLDTQLGQVASDADTILHQGVEVDFSGVATTAQVDTLATLMQGISAKLASVTVTVSGPLTAVGDLLITPGDAYGQDHGQAAASWHVTGLDVTGASGVMVQQEVGLSLPLTLNGSAITLPLTVQQSRQVFAGPYRCVLVWPDGDRLTIARGQVVLQ
jgi:hypothetical protein